MGENCNFADKIEDIFTKMPCILHIETSTKTCSAALSQDGQVVYHQSDTTSNGTDNCGVLVSEALSFADSHAIPLDAVAVSEGPGSYTGLRVGTSTAKGVCYGRRVPLISVSTLKLLCTPVLLQDDGLEEGALLVPMSDARRMEVYAAVYDRALRTVREIRPDIVERDSYAEYLERGPVYFLGNGAEKCKQVICHPNARFIDGIVPSARYICPLAEMEFARKNFRDVAYFEPFYLKDFVAIKPKKLL